MGTAQGCAASPNPAGPPAPSPRPQPPRQHHPPKSRALAGCRCTGTFPQHQGSLQQAVNTSQEGGLGYRADQQCKHQALCHFHPRTHPLLPPTRLPAVATLPSSPCESSGGLYSALASSTLPSMATMSFLSTEETRKLSYNPHFCTGEESEAALPQKTPTAWLHQAEPRGRGGSNEGSAGRGGCQKAPWGHRRAGSPGRTGLEEGKHWVWRDWPWKL